MMMYDNQNNADIVASHLPCENCGSSDALTLYADGHSYCFSCEQIVYADSLAAERNKMTDETTIKNKKLLSYESMEVRPLKARKINADVCQKYGYFVTDYRGKHVQVASYYNNNNEIVGQKIRDKDKNFLSKGKVGDRFFGQHLWPSGGKKLVITEGEIDCLTVSQVNRGYPVVSLPCGAGSAKKTFKAQLDWLESFEEVIVMFDMDRVGREAVEDVAGILSPNKLLIATLPCKDANECLLEGKGEAIIKSIFNAKVYKPECIVNGADLWDALVNEKEPESIDLPWDSLSINKMTKGLRKGEMLLVTAGTGIGKTTIVREIAYDLAVKKGYKIGLMMLEENKRRTCQHIIGLNMNKRVALLWDKLDKAEIKKHFDETLGTGKFVIYDHFGSLTGDSLLSNLRYLAVGENCDFIILDHISIAVSGLEGNDERKQIDILMTRMRSLIEELGVGVIVVCHVRKTDGSKDTPEEGGTISLNDLRGSGTLKQIPDTIIAGERNQQEEEENKRDLIRLRCLKCRFTGETGLGGYLKYNKSTGRLEASSYSESEEKENERLDMDDEPEQEIEIPF